MNRDRAQCQRCAGVGVVQVIDDILRAGLADPFPQLAPAPCPVCGGRGWFGEVEKPSDVIGPRNDSRDIEREKNERFTLWRLARGMKIPRRWRGGQRNAPR